MLTPGWGPNSQRPKQGPPRSLSMEKGWLFRAVRTHQARKWPSSQKVECRQIIWAKWQNEERGTAKSEPDQWDPWWEDSSSGNSDKRFVMQIMTFPKIMKHCGTCGSYNLSAKGGTNVYWFSSGKAESSIWVASIESSQVSGRSLNAKKLGISILVSFLITENVT